MNKQIDFIVIDNNTGKQADISEIALKEDWAKGLMYCDMEGFAINENGQLVLLDECGNFVYCPYDRFTVKFENQVVLTKEDLKHYTKDCLIGELAGLDILNGLIERAERKEKEARKETAREIIEMFADRNYITEKDLINAIVNRFGVYPIKKEGDN